MNERPIARIADPRGPGLERMLAVLPPLRELTYRMALSGLSPHCSGDQRWRARIEELRVGLTEDVLAVVAADASAVAIQVMDEMD
jgi:hypothetical protein